MTYDATESVELGRLLEAVIEYTGLEVRDVMSMRVEAPGLLEIEALIRTADGKKVAAGDGVQSVIKRLRVDWPYLKAEPDPVELRTYDS